MLLASGWLLVPGLFALPIAAFCLLITLFGLANYGASAAREPAMLVLRALAFATLAIPGLIAARLLGRHPRVAREETAGDTEPIPDDVPAPGRQ